MLIEISIRFMLIRHILQSLVLKHFFTITLARIMYSHVLFRQCNITMLRSEAFNMYAYLHKYSSKRQTIAT